MSTLAGLGDIWLRPFFFETEFRNIFEMAMFRISGHAQHSPVFARCWGSLLHANPPSLCSRLLDPSCGVFAGGIRATRSGPRLALDSSSCVPCPCSGGTPASPTLGSTAEPAMTSSSTHPTAGVWEKRPRRLGVAS